MIRFPVSGVLFLIAILPLSAQHHDKPLVTFESPTLCHGDHGAWRWAAKTATELPPDTVSADHHIKPSDIAAWGDREATWHSPRFGREKEWFAVVTHRLAQNPARPASTGVPACSWARLWPNSALLPMEVMSMATWDEEHHHHRHGQR
jgi:hypothetical protein